MRGKRVPTKKKHKNTLALTHTTKNGWVFFWFLKFVSSLALLRNSIGARETAQEQKEKDEKKINKNINHRRQRVVS